MGWFARRLSFSMVLLARSRCATPDLTVRYSLDDKLFWSLGSLGSLGNHQLVLDFSLSSESYGCIADESEERTSCICNIGGVMRLKRSWALWSMRLISEIED